MAVVTVGCKLPNGLVAEVGDKSLTFNGLNKSKVVGGFGITENVDADFWTTWLERNKEMPFVKHGFVFAHSNAKSMDAEIKEKSGEKTGLEQLDPDKKPAGIQEIEK